MTESLTCPYCGSPVTDQRVLKSEESMMVRCYSCGRVMEYIPGFGTFTTSDSGSDLTISQGTTYQRMYQDGTQPPQPSAGGACIAIICCMFIMMIMLPLLMFWILGFFP